MLGALCLLPGAALARKPVKRAARAAAPSRQAITRVLPFRWAPFPYRGPADDGKTPFLNVVERNGRRRGRIGANGQVLWEDAVYSDSGVLLHVPATFDPRRPPHLVVFFHGHGSSVDRVVSDMELTRQLAQADINAVLVAPQFAREAADSSPGKFWQPGVFARFLDEAALRLTDAIAASRAERPAVTAALRRAPVILVAFSGGYKPAAFVLERGGAGSRIAGVLLLDALYGEEERYARWFAGARRRAFLTSLYTDSTAAQQAILIERLRARRITSATALPAAIRPGTAAFVACGPIERHGRFVLEGPPRDPVRVVLAATRPPPPQRQVPRRPVVASKKARPPARGKGTRK